MSSLKMTFSLTSLIFLIALGLVFGTTSVMAHDGSVGNLVHDHPLTEILPAKDLNDDNDTTDVGEAAVNPHDVHPVVTSIVPEASSKASVTAFKGRQVILLEADGDPLTIPPAGGTPPGPGVFKVKVTFDKDLASDAGLGGGATFNSTAPQDTTANEVVYRVFRGTTEVTSGITSAEVTEPEDDSKSFVLTLTVAQVQFWTTEAGSLLPLEVYIDIAENAVLTPTGRLDGTALAASGNGSYRSPETMKLTIVPSFDATGPVPTFETPTFDKAKTQAVFKMKFSEQVKTGSLSADDFTFEPSAYVTSSTLTGPDADKLTYTLAATVIEKTEGTLTATLKKNSVMDLFENTGPAADTSSGSVTLPDNIKPTVTITLLSKDDNGKHKLDANGKVRFQLDFSEPLADPNSISSLEVSDFDIMDHEGEDLAAELSDPPTALPTGGERYTLTVDAGTDPQEVHLELDPSQATDASVEKNTIDASMPDNLKSMFDTIPPTVVITVVGLQTNGDVRFKLDFDEPVLASTIVSSAFDRSGPSNYNWTKRSKPQQSLTDDTIYTIDLEPKDPNKKTIVQLLGGSVTDLAMNAIEEDVTRTFTPVTPAPEFVSKMDNIAVCDTDDLGTKYLLPKASDEEGDELTYKLMIGSVEVPNKTNQSKPATGLYWETVEQENRYLKGIATLADDGKYTWKVTDENGNEDSLTFEVDVKPLQKPGTPDTPDAMKADSASIQSPTQNRVKLTWDKAEDKRVYPGCIPNVTSYKVTQTMYDEVAETFGNPVTYDSAKAEDAAKFVAPTGTATVWKFTTPEIEDYGLYRFTITATNSVGDSPKSLPAIWDKTGLVDVVVADPPSRPMNLTLSVDNDGDQITLDWLKPENENGAPIDDMGKYKANTSYGGYVVYQTSDQDSTVTRYPKASATPGVITTLPDKEMDYDHPTFQTPALKAGEYTFRVTAVNIAGESLDSLSEKRNILQVPGTTRPPVVPPATNATYSAGVTTIGANQMIAANNYFVIGADALPDIQRLFAEGGTISVLGPDTTRASKDVVISEIMWGLNLRQAVGDGRKDEQFIELYNTTAATINLSTVSIVFNTANSVPAVPTGKVLLDQVGNVEGTGWVITDAPGQSGSIPAVGDPSNTPSVSLISMYRYIDTEKTGKEKLTKAKKPDGSEVNAENGNSLGSWAESNAADTYGVNLIGSPGSKPFMPYQPPKKSTVAGTPFRINEFGNDTGSDNDWVELHNVSDSEASLKNFALSQVTAKGTDTKLFDFKDQDWKVPGKGYVVISTRHPRDSDLATGKDLRVADDQEANKGASHLFVVKPVNLQDDGKITLILRNAHDKQGSDANLIDVVATRSGSFADTNTSIWPLKVTGLPHENVIDGTDDEVFAAGKVYKRNSGDGRGEKQFAVDGYTGVGYDRAATATAANGGTPGYDNSAVKEKVADISTAEVTFSEIMLGLGEGRQNLPQWIELYNSSMIHAVNLNGWKLHVENHSDVATALDAVLTLDSMVIPPNQTVLIVTNTGRVSDPDHFPSNRVLNLWTTKKHRDALKMTRRTDQVFSAMGFNLMLTDKDGKTVDEAGNLDGNRRTRDELMDTWTIPMNGEDDGRRSSMIRVYDDGVAVPGDTEEAWVLADATNLAYAISETYYGDPDDYSTPGFRGGGPLPVSLSKFRPERLKETGEIVVRWITESELNNAGFNILRSEKRDGEFTKVHFVAGKGTTTERTTYEWKDTTAKPNVVYYYQIQDISLDGKVTTLRQSRLKGNVTATGKITTTWGDIKALQ